MGMDGPAGRSLGWKGTRPRHRSRNGPRLQYTALQLHGECPVCSLLLYAGKQRPMTGGGIWLRPMITASVEEQPTRPLDRLSLSNDVTAS